TMIKISSTSTLTFQHVVDATSTRNASRSCFVLLEPRINDLLLRTFIGGDLSFVCFLQLLAQVSQVAVRLLVNLVSFLRQVVKLLSVLLRFANSYTCCVRCRVS